MSELQRKIGQRIRNIRKECGITQQDLSSIISVNQSYIAQVEQGKKNITIDTLAKISNALEVSLSDLLQGLDNKDTRQTSAFVRINTILDSTTTNDHEMILQVLETIFKWKQA